MVGREAEDEVTDTDDRVERVARALHPAAFGDKAAQATGVAARHLAQVRDMARQQARAAIAAADQWRPIETAPTQKIILLFAVTDQTMNPPNWKMATGFWTPSGWWWDGRQLKDYDHQPTHWMPLPQPPEAK